MNKFLSTNLKAKWIIIAIIIFVGFFVKQFYFIVDPGERWMIIRLWNIQTIEQDPWFHFKLPFIDVVKYMNIQTQKIERNSESTSKDMQIVNSTTALNYRVDPDKATDIYKNIWDLNTVQTKIIEPAIQESVKASTALFTAEELIAKRQEVSTKMKQILTDKLWNVWLIVQDVNIINYEFSADFNKAIENKVKIEQEALAEKNRLEKTKYEAQQKIEQAKWTSEARLLEAKTDAEAIKIKANAVKEQWWKEYVQLKRIEKRDGKLPTTNMWWNMPVILDLKK